MKMRICFISAEFSPFAKRGGLGDVSSALSKYLAGKGHDVRVFIPLHGQMELRGLTPAPVDELREVPIQAGDQAFTCRIASVGVPETDLSIYLVDSPTLFDRPAIYTDSTDEHLRYLVLTRAALECCQRMQFPPHIVHCNDWHTAFAPLLLREAYSWDRQIFGNTRSVFTIHNIGYQGVFSAAQAGDLLPGVSRESLYQPDLAADRINPMRHAIIHADAITTVSPTYAKEICTVDGGYGLDGDLRARGSALIGILNGVDYEVWNPAKDPYIPHPYDASSLDQKKLNKESLLDLLRLSPAPHAPLIGMISRLTRQKGIDLLFEALPELLESQDVRFVALGSGEHGYEAFMRSLQRRFPGQAVFHNGYSEELAHFIEGAADMFLMPSLYEPCGLNQLYSLKYGTVPIVRRTGGLADSVVHFDPASGEGTGIVFNDFDRGAIRWALNTALEWYGWPSVWRRLMLNGMREDFSWERQGGAYERLYADLIDTPA
jgi:starch synthase